MDLMEAIARRRDTRHFTNDDVPKNVLERALMAAIQAPSVGMSQPYRFIDISASNRQALLDNFSIQRTLAETQIEAPERLELHRTLKLESLRDAPILLAVFCAYPLEPYTLGVIGNHRALEWSCACAVQNLWLSLTADGFGAGWVTILDLQGLATQLNVPSPWEPMGVLCIGRPATDYAGKPMLENLGWKSRDPVLASFYSKGSLEGINK